MILSLASRQRRLGFLIASGTVDGVSTGAACTAGIIAASLTSDSSNLLDFVDSFETVAISTLL